MTIIRVGDLVQFTSNEVGILKSLEVNELHEQKGMRMESLVNLPILKNSMAVAIRLSNHGKMLFLLCDSQEIVEIVDQQLAGIAVIKKEESIIL